MNGVFLALISIAFAMAAFHQLFGPPIGADGVEPMQALSLAAIDSAEGAVELALKLIGVMALFLGLMKVAEKGGLLAILARLIRPLMTRLFPEVPPDHPAMGAMIMNMAANALGLGNAATPFGIRAMQALDSLNPHKGTATNSMALFLAINTSSVTLLPTGVIALRAAAGSSDPASVLPTTLFATICSTAAAIFAAFAYQRFFPKPPPDPDFMEDDAFVAESEKQAYDAMDLDPTARHAAAAAQTGYPTWVSAAFLLLIVAFIPLAIVYGQIISPWVIPVLIVGMLGFGASRGVKVYEAFVEGAREGFDVAVRIIPYLVAILAAVGMFRASGAMDLLIGALSPITSLFGLPAEALPMALLRPLSGSGAYGVMAEILHNPAIGPDSYVGILVSTLQGSTETTFYVLAVYFGAVRIRRARHALAAALTADLVGIISAVVICSMLFN
ncbi:nucleoside recognition domain-containing protein [Magnetofaba australis]|uniref:Putative nucleoside recognition domain-containing protein n=1 Tax=Magnetofaba australis IT-1 TaxID=1434232 RepID=A0A1Y2K9W6_9PROT|nr:nucleoside recognition domain-containing protein [Magnetofaba australis]OSM06260.1 putative nucleoside recognition domain-containing protein [Magnetofaba australis IT-1]